MILRFTASAVKRNERRRKKNWLRSHRVKTVERAEGTREERRAVKGDPRTIARRRERSRTREITGSGAAKRKDGRSGAGKTCATW